jgi:hypothetical protein
VMCTGTAIFSGRRMMIIDYCGCASRRSFGVTDMGAWEEGSRTRSQH